MIVAPEDLQPLLDLYTRGLYLQAYRSALERCGALRDWTGADARCLAGRLASQLGAPRLSLWHRLKAWREHPGRLEVRYYYALAILEGSGPYFAWEFLKEHGDGLSEASAEERASWFSLHAQVLAWLRDFDRAEPWLARALDEGPDLPWVRVARSFVLQQEDRYEEALASADEALAQQAWFRPAVQARAHLLTLLDRDEEAFAFLQAAADHIECGALYWQLAAIHAEREEYPRVRTCLERFEQLSPLLERHVARSFHGLRSMLAYHEGDFDAAVRHARATGEKVMDRIADRLSDPARRAAPRVVLPVGFVRQHHVTCVPATLAAVSRFWSQPAEHLQIAEEICYNGTSAFAERKWAEEHGWSVREFTVTEPAARALIDAGIPFTLTTTGPGSGHLQAVVGYDARRGGLVLRDPFVRNRQEVDAEGFLADFAAFGPRGMALVPHVEQGRLAGLELPDAALWDRLHALDGALVAHHRDDAAALVEELERSAPGHTLTLHARHRLAVYDANPADQLAAVEALLSLHPDSDVLQLRRLALLRNLSRREERLAALRELCAPPDASASYLSQYAQELACDAREQPRVLELLHRALRRSPTDALHHQALGNLRWERQQREAALESYRLAVCLDDKDEQLAEQFFAAARHGRQTEAALDWLQRRFARFGRKSSLPARTLDGALYRLDRVREGLDVLEQALALRPDDGELRLYAAGAYLAASGDYIERACELLDQARDQCSRPDWLRSAARLEMCRANKPEALRLFREVLELQPLAVDVSLQVAQLLAELEGRDAARAHLLAALERFPHYHPLLAMVIEWAREDPPDVAEPLIRRVIERNPADAWAIRELGFRLLQQRRLDEAERCVVEAERLEPTSSSVHTLRGEVLAAQGRIAEARSAFRDALRLVVDDDFALRGLLRCCDTPAERRAELEFVRQELQRQVIFGDGLLAYRAHAHNELDPEELLALLQQALAVRPDLWHAWSACARQLAATGRLQEAYDLSRQATERFPLLPRLWLDQATIARLLGLADEEVAALETARRINPAWGDALRQLSEARQRSGQLAEARALLETAVAREPLDGVSRGWLAEVLWKQGEHTWALDEMERAVELAPAYEWAWGMLSAWSHERGEPARIEQAARRLTGRRPGDPHSWLIFAKVLTSEESSEECLAALDRALALNPRLIEAHGQRARVLALMGRHEEALAACRPAHWPEGPPAELQARAAWIEWQRGNADAAVAQMRAAVQADTGMWGGWQTLADWMRERRDVEGYLHAARELVRLDPHSEVALGYYGDALLAQGDRAGARDALHRAVQIDPAYAFGGMQLFDLLADDGAWDEADRVLAGLQQHVGGPYVESRAVRSAAHHRRQPAAERSLRTLCTDPAEDHDGWPLQNAVQVMDEAGWGQDVDRVLSELLDHADAVPLLGDVWAARQVARRRWESEARLRELSTGRDVGDRAIYTWIVESLQRGEAEQFRRFVRENAAWLRARTPTWASVCFGWTLCRDYRAGLEWALEWRQYSEVRSWMLVNVAEVFRNCGRAREGSEASQHALTLEPDNGLPLHHLWLAADDVTAGRLTEARSRLEGVLPAGLDDDYRFLHGLLHAYLAVALAQDAARALREQRPKIDALIAAYRHLPREPARRRLLCHILRDLPRRTGGVTARVWSLWQRFRCTWT